MNYRISYVIDLIKTKAKQLEELAMIRTAQVHLRISRNKIRSTHNGRIYKSSQNIEPLVKVD